MEQAKTEREQKITQAESEIEELKQELKVKKSSLESAKLDLDQAQENLEDTTITAPAKGTITKVDIEEGETATPGKVVITMIPEKDYKIEVMFPRLISEVLKRTMKSKLILTLSPKNSTKEESAKFTPRKR